MIHVERIQKNILNSEMGFEPTTWEINITEVILYGTYMYIVDKRVAWSKNILYKFC